MIGRDIPDFDFSVPGVSSLSADLHKFGFTPKPASTVFYRTADMAEHHSFDFSDWPNGRFLTVDDRRHAAGRRRRRGLGEFRVSRASRAICRSRAT